MTQKHKTQKHVLLFVISTSFYRTLANDGDQTTGMHAGEGFTPPNFAKFLLE